MVSVLELEVNVPSLISKFPFVSHAPEPAFTISDPAPAPTKSIFPETLTVGLLLPDNVTFCVFAAFTKREPETVCVEAAIVTVRAEALELEYISAFAPNVRAGMVQSPAVASMRTLTLNVPPDGTVQTKLAVPNVVVPVPVSVPVSVMVEVAVNVLPEAIVKVAAELTVDVPTVRSLVFSVALPAEIQSPFSEFPPPTSVTPEPVICRVDSGAVTVPESVTFPAAVVLARSVIDPESVSALKADAFAVSVLAVPFITTVPELWVIVEEA